MSISNSKLPERASLEYLKKLAKDRLRDLRRADPQAKLATALLAVARDHGFSSWRALKDEIERRQTNNAALFFEACAKGDIELLRGLLANDPSLVRADRPDARYHGWTGLHAAAERDGVWSSSSRSCVASPDGSQQVDVDRSLVIIVGKYRAQMYMVAMIGEEAQLPWRGVRPVHHF